MSERGWIEAEVLINYLLSNEEREREIEREKWRETKALISDLDG